MLFNLQENRSYLSGKFSNILVFPSAIRIIQALESWIYLDFRGLWYELGLKEKRCEFKVIRKACQSIQRCANHRVSVKV